MRVHHATSRTRLADAPASALAGSATAGPAAHTLDASRASSDEQHTQDMAKAKALSLLQPCRPVRVSSDEDMAKAKALSLLQPCRPVRVSSDQASQEMALAIKLSLEEYHEKRDKEIRELVAQDDANLKKALELSQLTALQILLRALDSQRSHTAATEGGGAGRERLQLDVDMALKRCVIHLRTYYSLRVRRPLCKASPTCTACSDRVCSVGQSLHGLTVWSLHCLPTAGLRGANPAAI